MLLIGKPSINGPSWSIYTMAMLVITGGYMESHKRPEPHTLMISLSEIPRTCGSKGNLGPKKKVRPLGGCPWCTNNVPLWGRNDGTNASILGQVMSSIVTHLNLAAIWGWFPYKNHDSRARSQGSVVIKFTRLMAMDRMVSNWKRKRKTSNRWRIISYGCLSKMMAGPMFQWSSSCWKKQLTKMGFFSNSKPSPMFNMGGNNHQSIWVVYDIATLLPSGNLTVCDIEHGHSNSWFTH